MHAEAHCVLEDVLMTCKTINAFGDLAIENLQHGIPNDLADVEKESLIRAFRLMRLTLDCVNPLITATVKEGSQPRRM
ncbi:hypothetical protein [Pseudomonas koreensis]|jgi:hypothetical protein|uniref:hypothetical protein n=1 Tax=Pseudomonas koreensis TaxID=198620 RepID=UPI001B32184D|nr:hypothetical protein [Pseudomonas koreensis]MBP4002546.1 hypothetical protein [Pseudomonas koreensis]